MSEGLITKALSGTYDVMPVHNHKETIQCRGRGILKLRGVSPLVGDRVLYEETEHGQGVINELLPRRSELIRPPVANVDLVVVVFSLRQPDLHLSLLDKFLAHTEHAGLETVICFTKRDLNHLSERSDDVIEDEQLDLTAACDLYQSIGYPIFVTSTVTGEGLEALQQFLKGRIAVFSGQSGVGKSSLLNAMVPHLQLETGEVSTKLGRGKHTTRHVELVALPNGGVIADTPGFSQLDFAAFELEDVGQAFKEFADHADRCKFRNCLHQHEPQCAVITAKETGKIAESRYDNYIDFLNEVREKERRY